MKRRFGGLLLILVLLQAMLPAAALAAGSTADNSELNYVEIPLIDPRNPSGGITDHTDYEPAAFPGVEEDFAADGSEPDYVEIPLIDPRYPSIGTGYSSRDSQNAVRPGDYQAAKWVDRYELPWFARDFYYTLVAESKPRSNSGLGRDGALIDPSQSPYIQSYSDGAAYVLPIHYPTETALRREGFQFTDQFEFVKSCINAAFNAFDLDHPEVFWLKGGYGYSYNTSTRTFYLVLAYTGFPANKSNWDIRASDYHNPNTIKQDIRALDQSVASILNEAGRTSSNYEKIVYFNKWLTTNNQYNYTVAYTTDYNVDRTVWESIGALTTKTGESGGRIGVDGPVCESYARAFQLLCLRANIPCMLVGNVGHVWNYVQVDPSDSRWYAVDITWNDPILSGYPSESEYTRLGANSNMETTAYTLVGADTVVYDRSTETFWDRHTEENSLLGPGYSTGLLNELAYVDSVVITDLDAPVAGNVADTRVNLTSEPESGHHPNTSETREMFTNPVITWSPVPANGIFAAGTTYTATITYTPLRQGYGLTAADASKVTVAGAENVTVNDNGAIRVVFSANQAEASDFTYRLPTDLIYDGSSKAAAVRGSISSSIHNGYYTIAFTDERNIPVTDLVKPGTYRVLAKVSAHGGYGAAEVSLGSVTIRETSGLHGTVSISIDNSSQQQYSGTAYVASDTVIAIHVTPDPGYRLNTLQVIRADTGWQVPLSESGGIYKFTMPASDVSIQATFSIN